MKEKELKNYLKQLDKDKIIELYLQMRFERDVWQNCRSKESRYELKERINILENLFLKAAREDLVIYANALRLACEDIGKSDLVDPIGGLDLHEIIADYLNKARREQNGRERTVA